MFPTPEKLLAFAVECNNFQRHNYSKKSINDFVLWACGKHNPYWYKVDGRHEHCGAGVKPVYKALLKLFTPTCTGHFPLEERFTEDLWLEVTVADICKAAKRHLSRHQWNYARCKLEATGILEVIYKRCKEINWFTRMWIKINFSKLREILENMHILRMDAPKMNPNSNQNPGENQPDSLDPVYRTSRSSKQLSDSGFRESAILQVEPVSSQGSEDDRELSAGAESASFVNKTIEPVSSQSSEDDREPSAETKIILDAFLKTLPVAPAEATVASEAPDASEAIPFGERTFQGEPEFEVAQIIHQLKEDFFQDFEVTNDRVRKIQNLFHWNGNCQMTPSRVQAYVELASFSQFLPDWMRNLEIDMFLQPKIWSTIAKEINQYNFRDASEAQETLDEIERYPEKAQEALDMINSPPALERWLRISDHNQKPTWMVQALYGAQRNWVGPVFDMIRQKAKELLMSMNDPMWFVKSNPILNWSKALKLSFEEVEQLHQAAGRQLRKLEWQAYLGRINGVHTT